MSEADWTDEAAGKITEGWHSINAKAIWKGSPSQDPMCSYVTLIGSVPVVREAIAEALRSAHAAGRRAGLEEAAKVIDERPKHLQPGEPGWKEATYEMILAACSIRRLAEGAK